jgi:hypothetical protein
MTPAAIKQMLDKLDRVLQAVCHTEDCPIVLLVPGGVPAPHPDPAVTPHPAVTPSPDSCFMYGDISQAEPQPAQPISASVPAAELAALLQAVNKVADKTVTFGGLDASLYDLVRARDAFVAAAKSGARR